MKKTLVSIVAASLLALNFTGCGSSKSTTSEPTDNGKEVKVAELGNVLGATVSVNGISASEMASGYYKFASTPTSGKITSKGGTIDLNNNGVADADEPTAPNMSAMVNTAGNEDLVTPFTTLVTESGMTASEVASILEINESDLSVDTSTITNSELKKKVILATAIVNSASNNNSRSLRNLLPNVDDTVSTTATTTSTTTATTSTTTETTAVVTPPSLPSATVATTTASTVKKTVAELLANIKDKKAGGVSLYQAVATVTGNAKVGNLETATDSELDTIHKDIINATTTTSTTTLPSVEPTPSTTATNEPTVPVVTPVVTPTPVVTATPTPEPTVTPTPTPEPTVTPTPTPEPTVTPIPTEVPCGKPGQPACEATPTPTSVTPTECGKPGQPACTATTETTATATPAPTATASSTCGKPGQPACR